MGRRRNGNGDLQRWMGRVEERLTHLANELKEERETAVVYRREIRDRVGHMEATLHKTDANMALIAATVAEMKPQVADYWQNRARAQGAAWIARIAWLVIGALGASIATMLHRL